MLAATARTLAAQGDDCPPMKPCHVGPPQTTPPKDPPTARVLAEPDTLPAWVASKEGRTYYRRECRAAQAIAEDLRIYFRTEKDAKKAGYERSVANGC